MKAKVLLISLIHYFFVFSVAHTDVTVLERKLGRLTGTLGELRGKLQTLGGADIQRRVAGKLEGSDEPTDVPTGEEAVGGVFAAVEEQEAGVTEGWRAKVKGFVKRNWGKILMGVAALAFTGVLATLAYKHYYPDSDSDEDKLDMVLDMAAWDDEDLESEMRKLQRAHQTITLKDVRKLRNRAREAVKNQAREMLKRLTYKKLNDAMLVPDENKNWGNIVGLIEGKIEEEKRRESVDPGFMQPFTEKMASFFDEFYDSFCDDFPTIILIDDEFEYSPQLWNLKVQWLTEREQALLKQEQKLRKGPIFPLVENDWIKTERLLVELFEKNMIEEEAYREWGIFEELRNGRFERAFEQVKKHAGHKIFLLYQKEIADFLSVMNENDPYDLATIKFWMGRLGNSRTRAQALTRMEREYKKRTFMRTKAEELKRSISGHLRADINSAIEKGAVLWRRVKRGLEATIHPKKMDAARILLKTLDPFMAVLHGLQYLKFQNIRSTELYIKDTASNELLWDLNQSLNPGEVWETEIWYMPNFLDGCKSKFSFESVRVCPDCPRSKYKIVTYPEIEQKYDQAIEFWKEFTDQVPSAWTGDWGREPKAGDVFWTQAQHLGDGKFNNWKIYAFFQDSKHVKTKTGFKTVRKKHVVYSFVKNKVETEFRNLLEEALRAGREVLDVHRDRLDELRVQEGEKAQKEALVRERNLLLKQERAKEKKIGLLTQEHIDQIVEEIKQTYFTPVPARLKQKFRESLGDDQLYEYYQDKIELYLRTYNFEMFKEKKTEEDFFDQIQELAQDFASYRRRGHILRDMKIRFDECIDEVKDTVLSEEIKKIEKKEEDRFRELGLKRWESIIVEAIDIVGTNSPFTGIDLATATIKLVYDCSHHLVNSITPLYDYAGGRAEDQFGESLIRRNLIISVVNVDAWFRRFFSELSKKIAQSGFINQLTKGEGTTCPLLLNLMAGSVSGWQTEMPESARVLKLQQSTDLQKNKEYLEQIFLENVPSLDSFELEIDVAKIKRSREIMAEFLGITLQDYQHHYLDISDFQRDTGRIHIRDEVLKHLKEFKKFQNLHNDEDKFIDTCYAHLYGTSAVPVLLDQVIGIHAKLLNDLRTIRFSVALGIFVQKFNLRDKIWDMVYGIGSFKPTRVWDRKLKPYYSKEHSMWSYEQYVKRYYGIKPEFDLKEDPFMYIERLKIIYDRKYDGWDETAEVKSLKSFMMKKFEEQKSAILTPDSKEGQRLIEGIKNELYKSENSLPMDFYDEIPSKYIYPFVFEEADRIHEEGKRAWNMHERSREDLIQAQKKHYESLSPTDRDEHMSLDKTFSPTEIIRQIEEKYSQVRDWIKVKYEEYERKVHEDPDHTEDDKFWFRFYPSYGRYVNEEKQKLIEKMSLYSDSPDLDLKKRLQTGQVAVNNLIKEHIRTAKSMAADDAIAPNVPYFTSKMQRDAEAKVADFRIKPLE